MNNVIWYLQQTQLNFIKAKIILKQLSDRDGTTIGKHINNALNEELDSSFVAKFATVASDGKTYQVEYDNLDVIDGNKRIAASMFIYFLQRYNILYKDGMQVIDNNTLAALTLLIAESNPKEKNLMTDLIMNFLI